MGWHKQSNAREVYIIFRMSAHRIYTWIPPYLFQCSPSLPLLRNPVVMFNNTVLLLLAFLFFSARLARSLFKILRRPSIKYLPGPKPGPWSVGKLNSIQVVAHLSSLFLI